jgi:uncharacterized protein (UPF0335 family)
MARSHAHADKPNSDNDDMFELNGTSRGQLRSIIERIERLEVEKSEIAEQIKEVKAEAKGNGFDVKIINRAITLRKLDPAKRQEAEALLELYLAAIGDDL